MLCLLVYPVQSFEITSVFLVPVKNTTCGWYELQRDGDVSSVALVWLEIFCLLPLTFPPAPIPSVKAGDS